MSWRRQIYTVKVIVEGLSERERIITLAASMMLIVMIWIFLIYSPQQRAIAENTLKAETSISDTNTLKQKILIIETVAESDITQKLIARFEAAKSEMREIEDQLKRYQQRFISEKELHKLLHDMLHNVQNIQIDRFESLSKPALPLPSQEPSAAKTEAAPTDKAKEQNNILPPLLTSHYVLVLRGDYLSIMTYLKSVEDLPWQIYWDKFSYEVKQYPEAVVTINFYTLRPNPMDL